MYQNNEQPSSVDGLAAALPCKTPVSLLQELCMRRGISPKYDLLQIEGAVHEPTFVYRVTVGEFTANGSGQSKKKAKHAAAKAVLDIIIHGGGPVSTGAAAAAAATVSSQHASSAGGDSSSGPVANNDSQHADLSTMVVSPYDDGIPGNPVGQLQELCMTRRWPPPTYQLTAEEGFPHERTFSIACTIATYKEVGGGKSKKLAKRQAAYSMLQKLRDLPQEQQPSGGLNEDDDDVAASSGERGGDISPCRVADTCREDLLLVEDGRGDSLLLLGDPDDASPTKGRRSGKNKNKTQSLFEDESLSSECGGGAFSEPLLFADQTPSSLEIKHKRNDLFENYRSNIIVGHDHQNSHLPDGSFENHQSNFGCSNDLLDDYKSNMRGSDSLYGRREGDQQGGGSLFPEDSYRDVGGQFEDGVDCYGGSLKQSSKKRGEQRKNRDRGGGGIGEENGFGLASSPYGGGYYSGDADSYLA